ncbi:uncharacterized protein RCC_11369 [Ramularia collo-cygni]|uniref:Uncharacterized protein n=1 Tax=Ramularia collo-cygni TaxID=112498 RepID=A0A2D3VHS8_9PEZI|nr:uncharacterized protein RCC_11369 [Ramularia collo-cygni]CZT25700.1 uncharacterized protein RCC_11369 [Ramularia collo-cygni]
MTAARVSVPRTNAGKDVTVDSHRDDGLDSNDLDGSFNGHSNGKQSKKAKVAPKAKETKPIKPFRFLDLPAELRDQICGLALTEHSGITLVSTTRGNRHTVRRCGITLQEGTHHSGKLPPSYRGRLTRLMSQGATQSFIGHSREFNL